MKQRIIKYLQCKKGFSAKEFLMAISVIGILCAISIPQYYSLKLNSSKRLADGVATAITHALKENLVSIPIDANPLASHCESCFSGIPRIKVTQNRWYKNTDSEYFYYESSVDTTRNPREKPLFKIIISADSKSAVLVQP